MWYESYLGKIIDKNFRVVVYLSGNRDKGCSLKFGFLSGLDSAFQNQVKENNWGLVLVKDEIVLKEAEKLNLKNIKKTGIPPKFDGDQKAYTEWNPEGKKRFTLKKKSTIRLCKSCGGFVMKECSGMLDISYLLFDY